MKTAISTLLLSSLPLSAPAAADTPHSTPKNTPTAVTKVDEKQSFNDYEAVTQALQPYIQAASSGVGETARSAFLGHAHIVGTIGGQFSAASLDDFLKSVSSLGASPNLQHRIVWIDISGPAAAAKIEFIDWKGFRFTDFFVLFKHEGEWKISGKVYDSHSNN